ncbi:hypothetical protein Mapa_013661 [Marchantia paleacea]|nr:hypothetical protein Mapa_013661 [Marchantia paleacea]
MLPAFEFQCKIVAPHRQLLFSSICFCVRVFGNFDFFFNGEPGNFDSLLTCTESIQSMLCSSQFFTLDTVSFE